ncbi:RHS repeat protein [Ralstonia sp. A12]|uniref:RHS repeat protein n=1 Tax=Ralstonia sp. A12 TaxID=1217052 RepID=UPI000A00C635|nr:RHS repeat protein [Ralstonia sp. A12]
MRKVSILALVLLLFAVVNNACAQATPGQQYRFAKPYNTLYHVDPNDVCLEYEKNDSGLTNGSFAWTGPNTGICNFIYVPTFWYESPWPTSQPVEVWRCPGEWIANGAIQHGDFVWRGDGSSTCVDKIESLHARPQRCEGGFGNPIYPLTGSKVQSEVLGSWTLAGQSLTIDYNNQFKVPANYPNAVFAQPLPPSFGGLWLGSLHKNVSLTDDYFDFQFYRGLGHWVSFTSPQRDRTYTPNSDVNDRMGGAQWNGSNGFFLYDADARAKELYSGDGALRQVSYANGASLSYTYSDSNTPATVAPQSGLLIRVQDQTGRSVQFQYVADGNGSARVNQITMPDGQAVAAGYDTNGNLNKLTWPDGAVRQYLYERTDLPWALTGIVDENGSRLSTYSYDAQGRATDTQLAGGVNHYGVSYTTPPNWNIVENYDSAAGVVHSDHYWAPPQGVVIVTPNGSSLTQNVTLVNGVPRMTSQSQPAGSGCTAASNALTYDANGNKASEDDFNGNRACYAYDLTRNLETTRVEGLGNGMACSSYTPNGSSLPGGARKVSTVWHPDWTLPTQVAEPGKITTYVYNGQPDPFNGNATASCASGGTLAIDGKPLAVLCKQVEQLTTDTDGHLGLATAQQSGVTPRVQQWTYSATGQVLTEQDPLNNVITYAYYSDTNLTGTGGSAVGHTLGDLQTVTNAKGQVTTYSQYNAAGLPLQVIDPNGVTTTSTYDPRLHLLSTSVGGQTTAFSYDAVGQLLQATRPDGSWIGYEYDAAHRLVATKDSQGNRIEYTLDNAGNRVAVNVKEPGGNLTRSLSRSIDVLGRVQQITGRE